MDKTLARRVQALEKQLADARRRLEQRPVLMSRKDTVPYYTVLVVGGNTLETGQDGVNYESEVASVPSAYDPNVTTTFIDGIGRGTLFINNVAQSGYVLILNSDAGSFRNALLEDDVIFSGGPVSIPVDGGGFVRAYVAG